MPPRTHTLGEPHRFHAWLRADAGRELCLARHMAGATMQQVVERIGCSKSTVSRIERGRSPRVTLERIVLIGAAVGLRPSLRFFPTQRPVRDEGQMELLAAFTRRMHPAWLHRHELPMPRAGDLRAADQVSSIQGCRILVEAYRRFVDYQAQVRAVRGKQRDLGTERVVIVVEDTRVNRRAIQAAGAELRRSFPLAARKLFAALAAGQDPGADALVLLRRTPVASQATNSTRGALPASAIAAPATGAG